MVKGRDATSVALGESSDALSLDASMSSGEGLCEDPVSSMVLDSIKRRLLSAFRDSGAVPCCAQPCGPGMSAGADEELRRVQVDGAITWVRTELLEMRCQDRQLAQTLLELNTEIQKLRREQELCGYADCDTPPAPRHRSGSEREETVARRAGRKRT
ncbi:alanine and arginine-rich domain-containing protein [Amblyraja radiata]|uniref:alanine and arginine-rich domain-containing protein n=1 Tax=Amblyraja radiata TaxID=386614 RepID=UPI0014035BA4|nr:alanine and arginine-rich domain-containing protein [Amblyraja radiata]